MAHTVSIREGDIPLWSGFKSTTRYCCASADINTGRAMPGMRYKHGR